MDFSPWDWEDTFRLHIAACLIVGVMPLSKRFPDADEIPATAKPVLKKLYTAYYFGTMLDENEVKSSPQNPQEKWLFGIAPDASDVKLVWKHPKGAIRKGTTTLDMDAMILGHLKHAMVSREELHRWVQAMGINSAYSFSPRQADTQTHAAVAWSLKKPKRFQGYTEPLYLLLEAAHIAGAPIPKPREVLQAFSNKLPDQIAKVIEGESLDYYLADGKTKSANLRAIAAAITGMTGKSQD